MYASGSTLRLLSLFGALWGKVWALEAKVWDPIMRSKSFRVGSWVGGLGSRVGRLGVRVWRFGFRVSVSGLRVVGAAFRVQGFVARESYQLVVDRSRTLKRFTSP